MRDAAKRSFGSGFCGDAEAGTSFSERAAWSAVGQGWRQIFGSFRGAGLSFEWHDFESATELDWAQSFHPGSVEVCLNLEGHGHVAGGAAEAVFVPRTAGFYCRGDAPLVGVRAAGERHRFLTVEMSFDFLRRHLGEFVTLLHPLVRDVVAGRDSGSAVAPITRLTSRQQSLLMSLREPPVLAVAQRLWYQTKALELAAEMFFQPPGDQELFCQRQQRLAAERSEKVIALLRQNLAEPPTLEEIGRAVGCSPFHLSRSFTTATGLTITQYLRQLRLERAAALLRSGKRNVTEAALEVGYSSLSHFSQAFHEMFGCCPGLYPLKTSAQKSAQRAREAEREV
ncbi:MAG: helix-turn-helix transcriptional regulator [Verrucomicrobia bacterium]|nr:helix-turn-helix transcriptional regulator [Verrucomicrobiota bacterium]